MTSNAPTAPLSPGLSVKRIDGGPAGFLLQLAGDDDRGFHVGLALVRWADGSTDWNSTDRLVIA